MGELLLVALVNFDRDCSCYALQEQSQNQERYGEKILQLCAPELSAMYAFSVCGKP